VTRALANKLIQWKVSPHKINVLYDRPPEIFVPLNEEERITFLSILKRREFENDTQNTRNYK